MFFFDRAFFIIVSYQIVKNNVILLNDSLCFWKKDSLQLDHIQFLNINSLKAEIIKK